MSTFCQLQITAFGEPASLQLCTLEPLWPDPHQAVVRGCFASVNPIDAKTRQGLGWAAEANRDQLPWTPGYDYAGEVLSIGEGVSEFEPGSHVGGLIGFPLRGGAYSQYARIDAQELCLVPKGLSLEEAAALPLAGLTAYQALFEHGKLLCGERVMILAGAGGVGHLAVQLAVTAGSEVVTTSSRSNHDYLLNLGCREVLDYHQQGIYDEVASVDLLIDLVGGDAGLNALRAVRSRGRVVTVPTLTKQAVCDAAQGRGLEATGMLVHTDVDQLSELYRQGAAGQLKVWIAQTFELSQGSEAHRQIESGHTRGKLLLAL
jgi:NADPH2:quinone reductase